MSYIVKYFRLLGVVVEGPKACLLLVSFSSDVWWESLRIQSCPNFGLWKRLCI